MPKEGFEPTHPYGYYALNVARLPFRHFGTRESLAAGMREQQQAPLCRFPSHHCAHHIIGRRARLLKPRDSHPFMVGDRGLEPRTSCV